MTGVDTWPLAVLNTLALLLCVSFLVYVVFILRPFLTRVEGDPGDARDYDFHLLVPCLDEEEVIGATLRHLVTTFPRATVWCVDDGSTDRTPEILDRLVAVYDRLRVVTRRPPESRQGKGAALNAGWRAVSASLDPDADRSRVVLVVLDADARLEWTALDAVCGSRWFGDDDVAAVQLLVRVVTDVDGLVGDNGWEMVNAHRGERLRRHEPLLVQLQDMEFAGPIAAMQTLRRRTGSVGMGGNGQFTRLSALDRIAAEHGTPWHGSLLEDFEMGLHVLLTGGRTEYCDETFVGQLGLARVKPLLRQRSRWAQGGIECARYLWWVLSSPRVSLPGAVEIAYYLWVPWSQLLGSIVFPLAAYVQLRYALDTGGSVGDWWASGAWGLLPLALLFGALPHVVWGPVYRIVSGSGVTRRRALLLGVANLGYGYLLQASVWWAIVRVVVGRADWKKTARPVADPTSGGLPPTSRPTDPPRTPEEEDMRPLALISATDRPAGAHRPTPAPAVPAPAVESDDPPTLPLLRRQPTPVPPLPRRVAPPTAPLPASLPAPVAATAPEPTPPAAAQPQAWYLPPAAAPAGLVWALVPQPGAFVPAGAQPTAEPAVPS